MSNLREAAQQALEALEDMLGWQSLAPQTIQESAKGRAAALRAALIEEAMHRFTDVNQELEAALAEPVPVAWMHVPYPGNAISPMLSLSKHREPSIYAASVPLYFKEQL